MREELQGQMAQWWLQQQKAHCSMGDYSKTYIPNPLLDFCETHQLVRVSSSKFTKPSTFEFYFFHNSSSVYNERGERKIDFYQWIANRWNQKHLGERTQRQLWLSWFLWNEVNIGIQMDKWNPPLGRATCCCFLSWIIAKADFEWWESIQNW